MKLEHETCTVPNCERPHKARGYCQTHYMQFRRGDAIKETINTRDRNKPLECTVEGCTAPVKGKGLCGMHWVRNKRHGSTDHRSRQKDPKRCSIPRCERIHYSKGLCSVHYTRDRKWESFGLGAKEFGEMLVEQGHVCKICELPERSVHGSTGVLKGMAVDHCHTSGKVRGLLCSHCNRGLGLFGDDPKLLRRAALYVEAGQALDPPGYDHEDEGIEDE